MATRENRLWKWLKVAIEDLRRHLHMNRVENAVLSGMPDIEGHAEGGQQFWIELKTASRPIRTDGIVRIKFQPGQVPWLERRVSVGGRCFVLLQVGSGSAARRYLINGLDARVLENGASEAVIASMSIVSPKAKATAVVLTAAGKV